MLRTRNVSWYHAVLANVPYTTGTFSGLPFKMITHGMARLVLLFIGEVIIGFTAVDFHIAVARGDRDRWSFNHNCNWIGDSGSGSDDFFEDDNEFEFWPAIMVGGDTMFEPFKSDLTSMLAMTDCQPLKDVCEFMMSI
ncbi:unnamed protein product [Macrosiphum euphorbiae]|uniref:Uncharacterized protein n=1 Tax=Macrosiphum euphorbiae TaxID=13131 RepID=A0AAV0VTU9_9HEMI|nr:unnamed protein product [Macrosiphum euphorbiae]CAI6350705.1 unnamed protein product [Macrosiphum euphorbiae]